MLKIYLARHGQNLDNVNGILNGHRDLPLTELGLQQAKEAAEQIKKQQLTFTKVYCSPLQRAHQTAQTITTELGLPDPEVLGLLIERDFGSMSGQLISQIPSLCEPENILRTPVVTYFLEAPGAESFPEALARAQTTLDFVHQHHSEGNILLVGHGDFGKMLYTQFYKLDWREVLKMFHFGNSELILLQEGSLENQRKLFEIKQENL